MRKVACLIVITTLLSGCTKIIDVDLKNSDPQLVVEGFVTNSSPAAVSISKSVPFSTSNNFPPVSGALVRVTDNAGGQYALTETSTGNYVNNALVGVEGRTYNLTISLNGKEYKSSSTMPSQVNMDTILLEQIAFITENIWIVKPKYTDPPGFGNYYRFIEKINNVRNPTIWVWDDKLSNNGVSTRPLIQGDSTIKLNDTIEVEMQCIDRNIFRYFSALQSLQDNSTTPSNPDTNITGGVLGYFSAHTSQKKKVVVK
jgi:Domain of unknown function (DUF4249)